MGNKYRAAGACNRIYMYTWHTLPGTKQALLYLTLCVFMPRAEERSLCACGRRTIRTSVFLFLFSVVFRVVMYKSWNTRLQWSRGKPRVIVELLRPISRGRAPPPMRFFLGQNLTAKRLYNTSKYEVYIVDYNSMHKSTRIDEGRKCRSQ